MMSNELYEILLNNNQVIDINDINGNMHSFNQIAVIPYNDELYLVLSPINSAVVEQTLDIAIFKAFFNDDKKVAMEYVENSNIQNAIIDILLKEIDKNKKSH